MNRLFFFMYAGGDFFSWLETHLLSCPLKKFTGIDCPGCGLQRSVVALIKGDFAESIRLYPATMPIVLMLIFTFLHVRFRINNGAFILKVLYILCSAIVALSYIYKIITKTTA